MNIRNLNLTMFQECERNTQIKDKMRDTCLTELAQFWFDIIVSDFD